MNSPSTSSAVVITRFPYESQWGGEESHTLLLARDLREQGHAVIFMGSCPVLLEKFAAEGFTVQKTWGGKMIVTPWQLLKSFFLFPFIQWNIRRTFKNLQSQFDIRALYCLSLNEKLFLSDMVVQEGIPVTWVEHEEIRGWLLKNPWNRRYKKNAEQVKIVPICQHNRKILTQDFQIPLERIVDICNGVNVSALLPLGAQKKRGFILYANRLIAKKGVMDFLEAIELLTEKDRLTFMVIGDGELESQVQEKVHSTSLNISYQYILKKENWYSVLADAEVFVCCSKDQSETFSLNTAEAMAAGCKVVVTNPCGITEHLQDGYDALFAEADNPTQLAMTIQRALDSSPELGSHAKKTAQEKFDQQKMLQQYSNLLFRTS